ncbi:Ribosomal protein L11 methyltransferase [Emticicia oligotrophica DSM 17448]|uniref:Ribosomal protein L11 methyltransferase n=1 Tax=Emticicia oligotrophica (strain DSM 17448 / CIP 109782 / MTCC 6937 / GPTSA100-15) TaxID=929562 RepID=A0ABM5N0K2_EMTOG|nr:50S ribosomal protein L11 methyltransferase [Emticicia oligotrophica]AFK02919.1 Ribosomal protein L11 methyltransferase [Emticicia oligotrophica DSM 17448]
MSYIELSLQIDLDFAEIMMAELAELGFESFIETEDGLEAYIQEDIFDDLAVKNLIETYAERTAISYSFKQMAKQNWNEEWEKNFQPISIGKDIYVRADFHEPQFGYRYEIIITPKMSFGTGHHETTSMVMEHQLNIPHENKKVLDVGTGTGILAVLAEKLGASYVSAFDIDEWSVENTTENIGLNNTNKIEVRLGTIEDEPKDKYDIVLANINRNILLQQIPIYATFMSEGASLVISGFYESDIADIQVVAEKAGLKKVGQLSKNQWASVVFKS